MTPYVEQDCTFTHKGHSFTSGGAVITDAYIIGYMSSDMRSITTWKGEHIGNVTGHTSWPLYSYLSTRMYQVRAEVNGRRYSGRTCGAGMVVKLYALKGQ